MSLRIKNYKLVTRRWLDKNLELLEKITIPPCECKYFKLWETLKVELEKSSFNTTNKAIDWWRITESWGTISATPELDE